MLVSGMLVSGMLVSGMLVDQHTCDVACSWNGMLGVKECQSIL